MIAYCPLDEVEPSIKKQKIEAEEIKPHVGREETELNYVVMAFIVGVIVLAVSDSIRV
jgi:hypothetical protein